MTFSTVSMTFSTVCNKCTTRCCHFSTQNHLNKTFPCPNCGQNSAMTNISSTEVINGRTFIRVSVSPQQEEPSRANSQATSRRSTRHDDANSTESFFKKPMPTTGDANSTHEAQRLFKNPMTTTGDANSTHEAQRLFKNP